MLVSDAHLDVGDDAKSRADFIREGVYPEVYERHLKAWFFFSQAFELETDLRRFRVSKSPGKFWKETVRDHSPKSTGDKIVMRKKLSNFKVEKGVDPIKKLYSLEELVMMMNNAGIPVDEQTTLATFVAGLTVAEYDFEIRQSSRKPSFDRDEVINTVEAQYNLLRTRKLKNPPTAHALVVDVVGPAGEDALAESEEVVGEVATARAPRTARSPATETAPRTARQQPRDRCVTNANCAATSPANATHRCARGATDEDTTRISVRPLRT